MMVYAEAYILSIVRCVDHTIASDIKQRINEMTIMVSQLNHLFSDEAMNLANDASDAGHSLKKKVSKMEAVEEMDKDLLRECMDAAEAVSKASLHLKKSTSYIRVARHHGKIEEDSERDQVIKDAFIAVYKAGLEVRILRCKLSDAYTEILDATTIDYGG